MHNRYKGRLCRVLNSDLKVLSAKLSFYDTFKVTPNETLGNFTDMKRISQEFSELISTVLLDILINAQVQLRGRTNTNHTGTTKKCYRSNRRPQRARAHVNCNALFGRHLLRFELSLLLTCTQLPCLI
jgi:hypothetical protein